MNFIKYTIYILLILFTAACASVTSPGGGPKDEDPPVLIYTEPTDQSINFTGSEVILEFDEFIELNNYVDEILITPRLVEPIEAISKKRRVIIQLGQPLDSNTTYTMNFREAIRDLTEKNPAKDLKIAFSTGNYIDSAYLSGRVMDAKKNMPLKNILVGAYFAEDTLNILNQAPNYMSITNEDGTFRLDNLKTGSYRLYALKDLNKNSMLDFKTESYGFVADTLVLDSTVTDLEIPILYNDVRTIELQSSRTSGHYFLLKFNKAVKSYDFESQEKLYSDIDKERVTIRLFNTLSLDSIPVTINVTDSLNDSTSHFFYLKFNPSPRPIDPYELTSTVKPIFIGKYLSVSSVNLSKPSIIAIKDSIYIRIDSTTRVNFTEEDTQWNYLNNELTIKKDLSEYYTDSLNLRDTKFIIGKGAFISIENDTSDLKSTNLQWIKPEQTGTIEVEVKSSNKGYIVQLLNKSYSVLQESYNTPKFNFNNLPPGSYILRLLIDENNNGRWDRGNILKSIEPEPVMIYLKTDGTFSLDLKANWVLGPHVFTID